MGARVHGQGKAFVPLPDLLEKSKRVSNKYEYVMLYSNKHRRVITTHKATVKGSSV